MSPPPESSAPGAADPDRLLLFREAIRRRALECGFSRAGFTTAEPLDELTQRRWQRWRQRGVEGEMDYLVREHPRRTHPRDLLPEAETVLVVAASYYQGDHPAPIRAATGRADGEAGKAGAPDGGEVRAAPKIARYAWGEDYHHVLRGRLETLARWIEAEARGRGVATSLAWRAFADSAPLDERSLAVRAGLGFFGKNTLLLDPEAGSWTLLAELLLSLPLPPDEPQPQGRCGSCRKCLDACPTGAITGPYELDPRRCISYLTIEQRGPIPADLETKLGGWAFGCDICQEVCPYNARPLSVLLPEFDPARGAGPHADEHLWEGIESKKAFARRWARSPVERAGLDGMRRNVTAARRGEK